MRSLGNRQRTTAPDEENPYWVSFSDIMAGLLVIFILAVVVLILEIMEQKEELDIAYEELAKANEIRRTIIQEIAEELNNEGIPVVISENQTILRIPEDVLSFESREFNLPEDEAKRSIALRIGSVIVDRISYEDRWQYLDTVFIEGHTDRNRYNNPQIKGNWGLSTFRAISLWEYWNAAMPESERPEHLQNHLGDRLFSVSGYAETRPVPCTNADPNVDNPVLCPDGRLIDDERSLRMNRRIDIRFTVKVPSEEVYLNN